MRSTFEIPVGLNNTVTLSWTVIADSDAPPTIRGMEAEVGTDAPDHPENRLIRIELNAAFGYSGLLAVTSTTESAAADVVAVDGSAVSPQLEAAALAFIEPRLSRRWLDPQRFPHLKPQVAPQWILTPRPAGWIENFVLTSLLVAFLLSLYTSARFLRTAARKNRVRRGLCPLCEYPTQGLATPTCPECGNPLSPAASP